MKLLAFRMRPNGAKNPVEYDTINITPAGQRPGGTIYGRGKLRMFNIIIFLIGAGIMFYMAWRSWSRRRKLHDQGRKGRPPAVAGTAQGRDGQSLPVGVRPLLAVPTASITRKSAKGRELCSQGDCRHPYIITPTTPPKMYVEGDKCRPGCRGAVLWCWAVVLLVLMAGICAVRRRMHMKLEHFGMPEPGDCRVVFSASS